MALTGLSMGRAMGGYAVRPLLRMPDKTSSPAASRRQLLQGVAPEVRPHLGASLAVAVGAAVAAEVSLHRVVLLQAVVAAGPAGAGGGPGAGGAGFSGGGRKRGGAAHP